MSIHTYFCARDYHSEKKQLELQHYIDQKGYQTDQVIEESCDIKVHWEKREIGRFLLHSAAADDELIVYDALDMARSTCQILEVLMLATRKGVKIHFVRYQMVFQGKPTNSLQELLALMQHVENDYIQRRTTDALARRKAAGLPLGRPRGRKNKSLKLDKHRKEILRYLALKVSKASIARLVGCHPQTLYDWLDRQPSSQGQVKQPQVGHKMVTPESVLQENQKSKGVAGTS